MQKKYLIILILCIIAIINAGYLSYHAYAFWFAENAEALRNLPCDLSSIFSCSDILRNPRALIFGIPFPMIALVVYPVLFVLALSGYLRKSLTEAKIITVMALMGMCFNGYVISQEVIVGIFCPLCLMCTIIIVSIAAIGGTLWKKGC
jgi:uncharacterized membrane protein